jgi:hypothetical protein
MLDADSLGIWQSGIGNNVYNRLLTLDINCPVMMAVEISTQDCEVTQGRALLWMWLVMISSRFPAEKS